MEYEQPCRFPADDPNRLWILVAGRQMPYWEALRWFAVLKGKRKTLPLIAFVLCLLYAMVALSYAGEADISAIESATASAVILTAVAALSVAMFFLLSYPKKKARVRIVGYDADVKRHAYGSRIAFYTDRIAVTTLRGTQTMKFSDVELCVETYDGFLLLAGESRIVIRSEDLTVYDLQLIREYLTERLSPRVMCMKTPAQARLYQPLPIPQFEAETTVLTVASVPIEQTAPYIRERRARFFRLCAVTLPLMLILGVMLAALFMMTPYFLADLAIFCGACLVGGAVVSVVLFRLFDRRHHTRLDLRFEPDGLRLTADGVDHFVVKERVWLSVAEAGVTLRFFNHQTLFIPVDAVEDMAVLKALSGIE